jgi:hypothetical protein
MLTEFWAAVRRRKQMGNIKYITEQQMHFGFIEPLLLYCNHQYASANHWAIYRVISLRTRI